ncbi:C40 family peptidase [Alkalibacter rhizosphaerae]|uniref:C40 family peptidase n=1 Tax=Alkalibacter rhizosphaerae TaxID=2815577 RepID=A0A975AI10_9FIRM|nr:C40 family peptidase [Alkalibacter rhizosphaerae]QSX08588.1 C40 family peptidase [Alkalibacter rhizosphaerae]
MNGFKRMTAALISIALTAFIGLGIFFYQNSFSYEVFLNGERIGNVLEAKTVADALEDADQELKEKYGSNIIYEKEITLEKVQIKTDHEDLLTVKNNILNTVDVQKPAAALIIDGESRFILENEEEVDQLLAAIMDPVKQKLKDLPDHAQLLEVDFKQEITIEEQIVPVDSLYKLEEVMDLVLTGTESALTYQVATGDSAWTISRSFDVGLRSLEEANPGKDLTELAPGDVLVLSKDKPYLDIVYTLKETTIEKIPFETIKKKEDTLYVGQTKVEQQGIHGNKEVVREVTYINDVVDSQKVLSEIVAKEPVEKIVLEGTKARPVAARIVSTTHAAAHNGSIGSSIVAEAKRYLGVPYVRGGSTPSGFDCSGFTSYVYRQLGISIPRTSGAQARVGGYVARSDLKPGDLVAFTGHVGIYVGGGNFIHAPSPGKRVMISSMNTSYWRARYISGRRVY